VAFLGAPASGCPGPAAPTQRLPDEPVTHTDYGKPELSKALIAERGAEPTGEKVVAELEAKDTLDTAGQDRLRVAIDQLEPRPMQQVQGDEAASLSITRARECLYRLRSKAARVFELRENGG